MAHSNGKGYIEDRRPASNIDPYLVCAMLVDTSLLTDSKAKSMKDAYHKWTDWRVKECIDNSL